MILLNLSVEYQYTTKKLQCEYTYTHLSFMSDWNYGFTRPLVTTRGLRSQLSYTLSQWQQQCLAKLFTAKVAKDHFSEYVLSATFKSNAYTSQSLPNLFAIKAPESVSSSTDKCWRLDSLWEKGKKQFNNFYAKYYFNQVILSRSYCKQQTEHENSIQIMKKSRIVIV